MSKTWLTQAALVRSLCMIVGGRRLDFAPKAQRHYPAIFAAYDTVGCSPEATHRPSRLSCREVYLAEAGHIDEDDLICEIAFPLGAHR